MREPPTGGGFAGVWLCLGLAAGLLLALRLALLTLSLGVLPGLAALSLRLVLLRLRIGLRLATLLLRLLALVALLFGAHNALQNGWNGSCRASARNAQATAPTRYRRAVARQSTDGAAPFGAYVSE